MAFFKTVQAKIKTTLKPVKKAQFACLVCGTYFTNKSKGCPNCGSGKTGSDNFGSNNKNSQS